VRPAFFLGSLGVTQGHNFKKFRLSVVAGNYFGMAPKAEAAAVLYLVHSQQFIGSWRAFV
jgi:hypothetical protein